MALTEAEAEGGGGVLHIIYVTYLTCKLSGVDPELLIRKRGWPIMGMYWMYGFTVLAKLMHTFMCFVSLQV